MKGYKTKIYKREEIEKEITYLLDNLDGEVYISDFIQASKNIAFKYQRFSD